MKRNIITHGMSIIAPACLYLICVKVFLLLPHLAVKCDLIDAAPLSQAKRRAYASAHGHERKIDETPPSPVSACVTHIGILRE